MKHTASAIAAALFATSVFAAEARPPVLKQLPRRADPVAVAKAARERAARRAAEEGGVLERKGVSQGKIVFIDTQTAVDKSVVIGAVENFDRMIRRYDIHVVRESPAKPAELKARTGASVAVILVFDDDTPSMLVSPDERWAVVNFKKLEEGLKSEEAKKKFFHSRCSKQLQRAFVAACGGINSSFKGNIMSVTSIPDLDLCVDMLPVDRVSAANEYMKAIGMKPRRLVFYSTACEEGWAPAPTNAVQKKIWDDVHKLPSKPITIDPEPGKPAAKK
ncbi:MAG: hypothetical protein J6T01_05600 [Kiritimatiellae bacterium]|nr:hypothetical protein [Kiritimatiellia bacterium]